MDLYTIFMRYIPVCWLLNNRLNEWNVDCIFSGHGGQVVLSVSDSGYVPDMGWLPDRL